MWSTWVLNVDMSCRLRATFPMSCSDMPTQSVAQPMRLRDPRRERAALDLVGAPEQPVPVHGRRGGAPDCTVDGSTQMKFAVQVPEPLIAGFPALSVCIFDNGVVSPRKRGTWNVPSTVRTPPSSLFDVTVNAGT